MEYHYSQVYAFGQHPGQGNPAGVLWDARGLEDADMQAIAQLNNLSETAFLFPKDDPACPYRIRFFTPRHPIAMCGHASIASAFVYWRMRNQPTELRFTQETDVGMLQLEVSSSPEGPNILLEMDQPPLLVNLSSERERLAEALGIPPAAFREDLPIMVNESGYLYLPVRSLQTVQELKPDLVRMSAMDSEFDLHGWYVFSEETLDPSNQVHCRFFAPYFGVPEDPVTGTANGYLAAYWLEYMKGKANSSFRVEQGFEMGRDGLLEVRYLSDGKQLQEVWVGGSAALYLEGILRWRER